MALDINKIIMESINNTLDEAGKDEKKEVIIKKDDVEDNDTQYEGDDILSAAIAPAIAAGLGALSLRTKVRNIG